jgi:hypothetical protein
MSSRRRKTARIKEGTKGGKPSQNGKEELRKPQKLPQHSQCMLSPLDTHYHVSSLNNPISKSSTNFMHNLSPFGNELIKHEMREE